MYTVSDIKTCHSNLWHNFGKCWPSCTFLSLLDSTINLQQDSSLLYFPSYPKCVTTLHCEIQKITISKSVMPLTQEHRCTCSFYRIKKLEVWTCMSLSQIKRTKCPVLAWIHAEDVSATHWLHHRPRLHQATPDVEHYTCCFSLSLSWTCVW